MLPEYGNGESDLILSLHLNIKAEDSNKHACTSHLVKMRTF